MDEPRYVDPDDPFEDRQANRDKKNLSGILDLDLLGKIRAATGRSPENDFASAKEKNAYKKIDKQYTNGMIPNGWIDELIEWAKKTMEEKR